MQESEQFDDLTTTDELMPPPEKATMSLKDFHGGEEPEFEPIHEDESDADRFIRENFEDMDDVGDFEPPNEFESANEEDYENGKNGLEGYQGEGSVQCPRCDTWLSPGDLDSVANDQFACPNCGHVLSENLNENAYSFYGIESYLLPKN
jgi:rubrerythrin